MLFTCARARFSVLIKIQYHDLQTLSFGYGLLSDARFSHEAFNGGKKGNMKIIELGKLNNFFYLFCGKLDSMKFMWSLFNAKFSKYRLSKLLTMVVRREHDVLCNSLVPINFFWSVSNRHEMWCITAICE